MKKMKKLWLISVTVITLLFSFSPSITVKAADAEFLMMHGEHVITCKVENMTNSEYAWQESTNQEGSAEQTLVQENEGSGADDEKTVILTNDGAVSISIIGGADGPTSIFLAGKIGTGFKVAVVVGVVLLAVAAVIIVKSIMKKKNKEK